MPPPRDFSSIDTARRSPSSVLHPIMSREKDMHSSQRKPFDEGNAKSGAIRDRSTAAAIAPSAEEGTAADSSRFSPIGRRMTSATITSDIGPDDYSRHQDSFLATTNDSYSPAASTSATASARETHRGPLGEKRMTNDRKDTHNGFTHECTRNIISTTSTIAQMETEGNEASHYFDESESIHACNDDDLILQQHAIMRQIQREAVVPSETSNTIEIKNYFEGASAVREVRLSTSLVDSPAAAATRTPSLPASQPPATSPSAFSRLASQRQDKDEDKSSPQYFMNTTAPVDHSHIDEDDDENLLQFFDDPQAIEEQRRIMEQIESQQQQQKFEEDESRVREKVHKGEEEELQQDHFDLSSIDEQLRIMEQIENERQQAQEEKQVLLNNKSAIEEQNRIMAQILQEAQQYRQDGVGSSLTNSEERMAPRPRHHPPPKNKPTAILARRSQPRRQLASDIHPFTVNPLTLPSSVTESAGRRTTPKSLLQKNEDLSTSSSTMKRSDKILDDKSSAFRRPPVSPGLFSQHPREAAVRKGNFKSWLQKGDSSSLKKAPDGNLSGCSRDFSDDTVTELYGGKKLRVHGTKQTLDDIASGNAIFVRCPGCQTVLQVGSKTKLLYCTVCTAVSPIDLVHDVSGGKDSHIACAFQEEEVEIKVRRKMSEKKKPRPAPRSS